MVLKRILYYILLILVLVIIIPILILGGIGSGIKVPGVINKIISDDTEKKEVKEVKSESFKVKVFIEGKNKIEEMDLEDYVKGVVCAEMPVLFDTEALKAQAVAARTYALAKTPEFGGNGCSKHEGADICNTVHCQAWLSKEERFKNWDKNKAVDYWKKIEDAVNSTSCQVLIYNGEIVKYAQYHSTSGGRTEDSIYAFKSSIPYLKSVESPYESESPSFTSTVTMKREEFIKRVKELSPDIKISNINLKNQIKIVDRTEGGRVKNIKIGDKTFSGVDIRWAMGLKSANFTISIDSKNVIFNVKGDGHGVGMSQWGANEMAKRGKKYDEILKHYYTGVEIKNASDIIKNKK